MDTTHRPTEAGGEIHRADFRRNVYVMNEFQTGSFQRRLWDQNISMV